MKILISGKQVNLGQSLQNHAEDKILQKVKKYFKSPIHADIHFSREGHLFTCDIVVNDGTTNHHHTKSTGQSDDIYFAFNTALNRLEKQLRKHNSKIKNHHKKSLHDAPINENKLMSGIKYIIEPFNSYEDEDEEENLENAHPVIIAESPTHIQKMSVSEAVRNMDLADLPAMIFINQANERINLVYYRQDGNISWIDPSEKNLKN